MDSITVEMLQVDVVTTTDVSRVILNGMGPKKDT